MSALWHWTGMSKEELEMKIFGGGDGELRSSASYAMSAVSGSDHGRNWEDQSRATRAHDRIPAAAEMIGKRLTMIYMWNYVDSDRSTIRLAGVQDFDKKISGGQNLYVNRRSAKETNKFLLQCRGRNADQLASTLTEIDKMYDRKLQREIEKCHQNYHTQLSSSLASLRAYRQNQDRWHQESFLQVISIHDEQNWPIQQAKTPMENSSRIADSQFKIHDLRHNAENLYNGFQKIPSKTPLPHRQQYVSDSWRKEASALRFGPLYPVADHQESLMWI
ncbi:hypothetical protein GUITHDRAFT_136305 [Guillardia theta CCMP2712]|uniref:Uncharacterized protein n=1 Tax=Guillardia theta (strain CCMP2712) TaxID=905079 RepID=L1JKU6_GUITC|nr:hypothetical protein GUITHDRAFT_136305 [Guillardia theta CCMP2712]EKX49141.1 hypothetical protein GUITHDRAFT_136305 [Guillardia theta CCMP2712]|eukprot:XP_005836121.1 hypothetical protein GUITHDRAFT_136305 [Guillardia theta CCMP2712]